MTDDVTGVSTGVDFSTSWAFEAGTKSVTDPTAKSYFAKIYGTIGPIRICFTN